MRNELEKIMPTWINQKLQKYNNGTWKKVATMDIYEDGRDMEFNLLPDM